jgi:hypothetical protein
MARPRKWVATFLAALEETAMVSEACKRAGISRQTAYEARQRDEEFAVAWHEVEERATERLEREAYRRAAEGTLKPVVSAGHLVTEERQYSDGLLMFLLKARRPEKYRDNVKVEHAGRIQHGHQGLEELSDADLLKRLAEAD